MKIKWIASYILATVFILVLHAERLTAQDVIKGLKGGLNLSHLSFDGANDKNIIPGFHVGGFVGIPLANKISVQPELLFSKKGSKWVYETTTYTADMRLNLSYLEVPVSLVYNLARDFDFQLGPYLGFLLGSNTDSKLITGSGTITILNDLKKEHFNSTDFGLQGGMRFYLNPIYLGFGYKLGLSQVAREGKNAKLILEDASNRSIQIYAGFAF